MKCHNKRLAFYVESLNPSRGGIERVTYVLSRELVNRGYEIYAIYTYDLPADKNLYSHYKAIYQGDSTRLGDIPRIIKFINDSHIEIYLNQIFTCYSSIKLQQAVKYKTSAIIVDVLHTTPFLLDSLKVFHRHLPIPYFLNQILFSIHKKINLKPRYSRGERCSYELCDAFVMLSSHYFSKFLKNNRIKDTRKLYAIANPCESVPYNADVTKEKTFLVVARLNNQQKRIDRTLCFWKKFHHVGDGWRLIIVGDGADKEMLEKMAERLELNDYSFEGHSDNPIDYYNRSMIFMMTSDVEGFGMTLIEAMSAGCVPVALNTFSALPDIVDNKKNGMIVAKDDIAGMIAASNYVIANFDNMSALARESVKRFAVENVVNKWEELFNKLSS